MSLQALPEEIKDYYFILSKKLLSIDGVSSRILRMSDDYKLNAKPFVKFRIDGTTLKICFSDTNEVELKTKSDLIRAYNILEKIQSDKK